MSLTATLDHHLTDNLVVSAEGRFDRGRFGSAPNRIFLVDDASGSLGLDAFADAANDGSNHQVLGIVQLMYEF
jgi:hypothetical protein